MSDEPQRRLRGNPADTGRGDPPKPAIAGWAPAVPGLDPNAPPRPIRLDAGVQPTRDGRSWRLGTAGEVAWITGGITSGPAITAVVPPGFAAYATFHEPDGVETVAHEQAVVAGLVDGTPDQPWWLGYLDTGAHDVVFDRAPRVSLYSDWPYVLVEAGPEQALGWRTGHMRAAYGVLPDLFFPADRSWLVAALWDDTWSCIGGPAETIDALAHDPLVRARPVRPDGDAQPPGRNRD